MSRKVGLVGCGYWGKNLARCFSELGALRALYDVDPDKARALPVTPPVPCVWGSFDEFLENVSTVAIATPPETHYDVARRALEAGKDVFIEKPMTTNVVHAEALVKQAEAQGRSLMVGHIYLHNRGIEMMPIPVGRAELYIQLLNEGRGPSESTRDVTWAGLPHTCSLALHFFPDWPEWIEAKREGDRVKAILRYWNGSVTYLDVGDNTGKKLRKVELRQPDRRYLFDVAFPNRLLTIRGDSEMYSPCYEPPGPEPLMEECKAFLEYKGVDYMGLKVVKLIEEILDKCKS